MTLEYAVELAKGSETQIIVFNVINQGDINSIEMVGGYFPAILWIQLMRKIISRIRKKTGMKR